MSRLEEFIGRVLAVALLAGLAVLYFMWGDVVGLTADRSEGDIALWVFATDAAPGDALEARARVDGGERASIRGVEIDGGGKEQWVRGDGVSWGDTITPRSDSASSTLDFTFRIPKSAQPDTTLSLRFTVRATEAIGATISNFTNNSADESFTIPIRIYTPGQSIFRRIARGVLAAGSWIAVVVVGVLAWSWYSRRERQPSARWMLAVVPYAYLGYIWFYKQMSAAIRLHGMIFAFAMIVAWVLALAVVARLVRYRYLPRYTVHPALIPTDGGAYRAAQVQVTTKPLFELEAAWSGAGFVTLRRGRYLEVRRRGVATVVPIPLSESIGGSPSRCDRTIRTT